MNQPQAWLRQRFNGFEALVPLFPVPLNDPLHFQERARGEDEGVDQHGEAK